MSPISPVFSNIAASFPNYKWKKNGMSAPPVQTQTAQSTSIDFTKDFPWLTDKTLKASLEALANISFSEEDINYLASNEIRVPFKNGKEAVDFIKDKNVRIIFDKPADKNIHAQYEFSTNIIVINNRYKKCMDFPVIIAIAEAILHECSHAYDNDGESSVQEELDCLGMNAVSHRAFLKRYGNLFENSDAPIINDGVSVYAKLFFDPDPQKQKLIHRVREKYGYLTAGDKLHPAGKIARSVKYLSEN